MSKILIRGKIFASNLVVGAAITLINSYRFLLCDESKWDVPKFFRAWGQELLQALPWILVVSLVMAIVVRLRFDTAKNQDEDEDED